MGMFGGSQSRVAEDAKNKAFVRRLQNEFQIMEADLKKLEKEREDARQLKTKLTRELALLSTHMRENAKILSSKERSYTLLEAELNRKKKELQNQPR